MTRFNIFRVEQNGSTIIETFSRREAMDRFLALQRDKRQILRFLINNSPSITLGPEAEEK